MDTPNVTRGDLSGVPGHDVWALSVLSNEMDTSQNSSHETVASLKVRSGIQ